MVIAARDEADVIGFQLEAVLAQEHSAPWEVIVADNGSRDGTQALVERMASGDSRLRLQDTSARPGTPFARNEAVKTARGRILLFTDADDVAGEGWLSGMAEAVGDSGFAAARLDHSRLNPPWTVAFRGRDQTTDVVRRDFGPPWPYGYGTSLGIARDLHEATGGFDEAVGPCADMDYCFRVQRDTGARLTFAPEAVLHYRHRTTLRETFGQARSYASDLMGLQRRYADVWRDPVVPLPPGHLALRAIRRLLFPDELGARRFRPVHSRASLGAWTWQVGTDVGSLEGARAAPGSRA